VVGLLNWELWAQAGHVAFACQMLVVVDGEDVTGRGRELHGQVGGGDNSAKGVEGMTTQEDIVGCWRVNDKEADWNGFGLASLTKHGVEVDVAAGGYLFARKAIDWFVIWGHSSVRELEFLVGGLVEDVNGAALVDKDFLNGVVFDFNSDDHGVIFLMVEAMKVVIYKDDGRHTTSLVGMGDMIDGLDMAELFLSDRRGGSSTSEAIRDGVDGATQGRVGGGDIGAGRFGFLVSRLGWASIVTGIVWRASVVESRGVAGLRGMIISTDEAAKMTSTDQFFYLILECFAVFCSVAMVAVVEAILGHNSIGRSACRASSRMQE